MSHTIINISSKGDDFSSLRQIPQTYYQKRIKIDKLDNLLKGSRVDLIKVNIEGYEEEFFKGAKETLLANDGLRIIFERNSNFCRKGSHSGIEYLRSLGFKIYSMCCVNKDIELRGLKDRKYYICEGNLRAKRGQLFNTPSSSPQIKL